MTDTWRPLAMIATVSCIPYAVSRSQQLQYLMGGSLGARQTPGVYPMQGSPGLLQGTSTMTHTMKPLAPTLPHQAVNSR